MGSVRRLLDVPSFVARDALMRNATSRDDGNNHDARISLILCCHAMMLQLMALRLMDWQAVAGKVLAPSLSIVGVLLVPSVEFAGGCG